MLENPILVRHHGKIGRALGFVSRTDQVFSARGDSGSLIIDQKGRPVAQIFGGEDEKTECPQDITLATPIEIVIEDIESTLKENESEEITVEIMSSSA